MPFNGAGVYTLPPAGGTPYVVGTVINPTQVNAVLADLQSAMNLVMTRDGQTIATGAFNMNSLGITNAGTITGATLASPTITGALSLGAVTATSLTSTGAVTGKIGRAHV